MGSAKEKARVAEKARVVFGGFKKACDNTNKTEKDFEEACKLSEKAMDGFGLVLAGIGPDTASLAVEEAYTRLKEAYVGFKKNRRWRFSTAITYYADTVRLAMVDFETALATVVTGDCTEAQHAVMGGHAVMVRARAVMDRAQSALKVSQEASQQTCMELAGIILFEKWTVKK